MVDEDLPLAVGGEEALLPVAVDAPVALLQPVRVPRDFVVDEPVAVVLEVQAFGGGVGGEQDAHRADFGSRLEGGFDILPLLQVHAAVHGQQPVVAGEALLGEDFLEPVLRGPVFGEEDDPLVAPFLVGANVRVEPVDQALHLRVELARRLFRPLPHLLEQGQFVLGRFAEQQRGGVHGVGRGFVVLGVVGVVLVDAVEFLLQDADRRLADGLATLGLPERFLVLIERGEEGSRAGEEPLLQRLENELGRQLLGVVLGPLDPQFGVLPERSVDGPFLVGVRNLDGVQHPLRETVASRPTSAAVPTSCAGP